MKKILLTITGFVVTLLAVAQSPNLMNYQGVARNAVGNVLPSQPIGLRLSILSGSPTGPVVYQETRNVTTNAFGLFNVVVGSPGAITTTGTIAAVNWTAFGTGSGSKFLQVEIDPIGGTNYFNVGSTQLVSVPYALYAGAAAPVGPAGGDLTGTYPNPQIFFPLIKTFNATTLTPPNTQLLGLTNSATTGILGAITGTSASNDANATAVTGTMSSTAPGSFSTGVRGVSNGTAGLGIGVWGSQAGSGYGVYGTTPNGWSVIGETTTGYGVWGTASTTGIGVYGRSTSNTSGWFENTNAANTAPTLSVTSNSTGGSGTSAISAVNTGTGRGGFFQVNNAASTANAIEATTNGTGASWGIRANSTGTNGAGLFVQSNATNTANNVQSNQGGLGRAGLFQTTNTATTADALTGITTSIDVSAAAPAAVHGISGLSGLSFFGRKGVWGETTDGQAVAGSSNTGLGGYFASVTGVGVAGFTFGTGPAVQGVSSSGPAGNFFNPAGNASNVINVNTAGTGIAANISNTNAANTAYTVQTENANTSNTAPGNATQRVGRGAILANTFVFSGIPTADWGVSSAGIGVMGSTATGIGIAGLTNNGAGVQAYANGAGGAALVGQGANAAGWGLVTIGRVQIQGQGAGVNKVLTSDNVGNATWATLAASGGVSGTGTLNYIPKWTPDGTTIGNSQLFDNGTNIGFGTTSPNGRMDIANAGAASRALMANNSSTTNQSSTALFQSNTVAPGGATLERSTVTALVSPLVAPTYDFGIVTAVKGFSSTSASTGPAGGTGILGSSGAGYGVMGETGSGVGLYGQAETGGYALLTNGRVRINGQGAAPGYVLTSTDAAGNATWQDLITPKVSISARNMNPSPLIPSGIATPITQWQTILNEDGGTNYNPGTGEYTITVSGNYHINASIFWLGFGPAATSLWVYVNGNFDYNTWTPSSPSQFANVVSYERKFNAGDKISFLAFQASGISQSIAGFVNTNSFSIHLIHR